ncbi:hypothetical protein OAE_21565 [Vibrio cyclitrophicus 1F289]|uniref:hypothetical protein n=1 Tax=Vibrio cyclitrophicus TaxID=47951 RepID=UPI0002ED0C0D|nr:hypothetical protein [Vibrio cyclitrophicus]OEF40119.1 hypothetical protein OAE_21565 [Vibrio cyclitrophicus 1F289]
MKSIEIEYKGQLNRLKKEYPEHHKKIVSEFSDLDKRHRTQRFQLNFFLFLIVGLVLTVYTHLDISMSTAWERIWTWLLEISTKGWGIITNFAMEYVNGE